MPCFEGMPRNYDTVNYDVQHDTTASTAYASFLPGDSELLTIYSI